MCLTCGCGGGGATVEGEAHMHVPGAVPPGQSARRQHAARAGASLHYQAVAGTVPAETHPAAAPEPGPQRPMATAPPPADTLEVPGRDAHTLHLEARILGKNQDIADRIRAAFGRQGILALNLVSSPGAGKTTLLERTITDRSGRCRMAVIEGDQATSNDAQRIRATGVRAVQINTGTGCHLEAEMVQRALDRLVPEPASLLLIENVGNLVCPALFDLGEHAKVVIFSVTEGEDKPLKYPHMFAAAQVLLVSKMDLLPHVRFDLAQAVANARAINPALQVFCVSAWSGQGMPEWYAWLDGAQAACQDHAA